MIELGEAELQASALNIKNRSRLKANPEDYILILAKGGLDVSTINDFSYIGTYWLENKKERNDCYMIFGPTEARRIMEGDQQKLLNHYVKTYRKTIRVYILPSMMDVISIIHSKVVENYFEEEPEDGCFGKIQARNKPEVLIIGPQELPIFAISVKNYLGS